MYTSLGSFLVLPEDVLRCQVKPRPMSTTSGLLKSSSLRIIRFASLMSQCICASRCRYSKPRRSRRRGDGQRGALQALPEDVAPPGLPHLHALVVRPLRQLREVAAEVGLVHQVDEVLVVEGFEGPGHVHVVELLHPMELLLGKRIRARIADAARAPGSLAHLKTQSVEKSL